MQGISFLIISAAIMSAYVGEILVGNVMSYIRSVGLVQTNSQSIMANIYTIYNSSLYMEMLFDFLNYCNGKKATNSSIKVKHGISNINIKHLSLPIKIKVIL